MGNEATFMSLCCKFTKNCWIKNWFREVIEGHNRNSRHTKKSSSCTLQLWVLQSKDIKDFPIHADGLIHLHPWRSSSFPRNIFLCHRNQRLIPPQRFNLFLLGLLIKVDTCTYHTSYNVCPIGSTRKSLYLPTFAVPKQSTIQVGKYTSPTDIAGVRVCVYIYIHLDSEVHTNACVHILTCFMHLSTLDSS